MPFGEDTYYTSSMIKMDTTPPATKGIASYKFMKAINQPATFRPVHGSKTAGTYDGRARNFSSPPLLLGRVEDVCRIHRWGMLGIGRRGRYRNPYETIETDIGLEGLEAPHRDPLHN